MFWLRQWTFCLIFDFKEFYMNENLSVEKRHLEFQRAAFYTILVHFKWEQTNIVHLIVVNQKSPLYFTKFLSYLIIRLITFIAPIYLDPIFV